MKRGNFLAAMAAALAATQLAAPATTVAAPRSARFAQSTITIIRNDTGEVLQLGDSLISMEAVNARSTDVMAQIYTPEGLITERRTMFDGWDGTLRFERRNNALDEFFIDEESAYYEGIRTTGVPEPTLCTIVQTIVDPSGEIHLYQYTNTRLAPEAIEYRRDKPTAYRVRFDSHSRVYIGEAQAELQA